MQELTRDNFRRLLREYLSSGLSLPQAYDKVIRAYRRDANIRAMDDMISNLRWVYQVPAEDAINIATSAMIEHNYIPYRDALNKYSANIERINKINGRSSTPVEQNQSISEPANANMGKLALPVTGMYDESAVNTDTDINEPSGSVVVGPDKESKIKVNLRRSPKPASYVDPVAKPTVTSAITSVNKPRKVLNKPIVVDSTPVDRQGTSATVTPTPTSNVSAPVAAPTLSSITSQAVRHNGGFDNYRRESVLSALRAAGGISPAEAVQRGIIPMEALNYV